MTDLPLADRITAEMGRPWVRVVTRDELQAREEAILRRHPRLRDWTSPCDCRSAWCGRVEDLTPEERDAADELRTVRWLLRRDEPNDTVEEATDG